ncbi:Zinc knuckle CX2CX4HX4C [Trema orientale]|uniref:Zinc knuckle CX2CX4HX4C n=1 Tax=Trema orientale TaxID=63057 RepID=A0A2P5CGU9_TREOI|nr:Zinc knuckle CX2CX4HX4C [Trema orientale]
MPVRNPWLSKSLMNESTAGKPLKISSRQLGTSLTHGPSVVLVPMNKTYFICSLSMRLTRRGLWTCGLGPSMVPTLLSETLPLMFQLYRQSFLIRVFGYKPMVSPLNMPLKIMQRVDVPLAKPLMAGFYLDKDARTKIWVQLKYERLSDFCYKCGHIGHRRISCRELKATTKEGLDGKDYNLYGPWLGSKCDIPHCFNPGNLSPSNSKSKQNPANNLNHCLIIPEPTPRGGLNSHIQITEEHVLKSPEHFALMPLKPHLPSPSPATPPPSPTFPPKATKPITEPTATLGRNSDTAQSSGPSPIKSGGPTLSKRAPPPDKVV